MLTHIKWVCFSASTKAGFSIFCGKKNNQVVSYLNRVLERLNYQSKPVTHISQTGSLVFQDPFGGSNYGNLDLVFGLSPSRLLTVPLRFHLLSIWRIEQRLSLLTRIKWFCFSASAKAGFSFFYGKKNNQAVFYLNRVLESLNYQI